MPPLDLSVPAGPVSSELRGSIERALGQILQKEEQVAVIGMADQTGMKFAAATRIGDSWKLGAEVEHQWGGTVRGAVFLVGSW